ncbi:MAG TPA: TerC/Alx family metal homeostasis membrane protein, partial [Acidimicrobiia bacterium]|nr:TerC/Alx family metal homeostasis membrane protein [Acidimicrobiia bacterium]
DLLVVHRTAHVITLREAAIESAVWILIGLAFGVVLALWQGGAAAGEYYAGFLIEKSLSIDNVFVWAVIFAFFAVPREFQFRVLFWGIFGALVMRAIFIFAGTALIEEFWWMLLVFGVVLLFSGFKVLRHKENEGQHGHDRAVKLLGRFLPVRAELAGQHFVVKEPPRPGQVAKWVATPLLAALVVVEVTDVVFAVDSVPAILAVSRDPFIVFASNAFAILGLRAMYFLLGDARERFHYLAHALGAILVFVGIKMIASHWYHFPTVASLGVIVAIIAGAIGASIVKTRREAGTVRP